MESTAECLPDCNGNGIPDARDIAECDGSPTCGDCNKDRVPDECESDDDGDGIINDCDSCPSTPPGVLIDDSGCPIPLGPCCFPTVPCIDSRDADECVAVGGDYLGDGLTCANDPDGDGAFGCDDACPVDPNKIVPGTCGCGVRDSDTDGDGIIDCLDSCTDTPADAAVNACGCSEIGACCFGAGFCWDDLEPTACREITGIYQGDGSICVEGCGFGDFDEDGDVDLRDFAYFQSCCCDAARGAAGTECQRGDIDGCGVIDSLDYSALHQVWMGPSR